MKTGEGKTLTSVLPAYLNAIARHGVHLVTVNDYLAKRDAEAWAASTVSWPDRRGDPLRDAARGAARAVRLDITYGTNNEFGFDYLRDNMAWQKADLVQRGHNFAIVDEADSILIDEARTPLIISGPAEQSPLVPGVRADGADAQARRPLRGRRAQADRGRHRGGRRAGRRPAGDRQPLRGREHPARRVSEQRAEGQGAVQARQGLHRQRRPGAHRRRVHRRVLAGRRYNEGLHQAIEAKEGVEVQAENQTLATITLQNYFRLYTKLSGMTGTAQTEAAELHQIYKMHVLSIPTNKPMVRADQADLIYKTEEAKFAAVADDIAEKHAKGQPVLVGTTSVEKSEYLAKLLVQLQVPHEVLNAKQHAREAAIIAQAGHAGAVTVATNMAGRGTDIVLGGNPEFLADVELRSRGLDPVERREEYEAAWDEIVETMKAQVAAEAEEVAALGGLYVLGTERHESRRIDNQLRGRSGRQGDPGESRFYLSLGDELMRRFNGQLVESIMNRFNLPDDVPIEAGWSPRPSAARRPRSSSRTSRSARTSSSTTRCSTSSAPSSTTSAAGCSTARTSRSRSSTCSGRGPRLHRRGHRRGLRRRLGPRQAVDGAGHALPDRPGPREARGRHRSTTSPGTRWPRPCVADAREAYARREAEIDTVIGAQGGMRELERQVLLQVMDRKWREHLYEMDYLKEGIGLRAMAQRDPLIEYQREGFDMFAAMLEGIKEETVGHLFNVRVQAAPAAPPAAPAESDGAEASPVERTQPNAAVAAAAPTTPTAPPQNERTARVPARSGSGSGGRHAAPEGDPAATTSALPTVFSGGPRPASELQYSGPAEDGGTTTRSRSAGAPAPGGAGRSSGEPARNRPCPCGSGRKYKHCHGMPTAARP